jgi:hypothetical protein
MSEEERGRIDKYWLVFLVLCAASFGMFLKAGYWFFGLYSCA